MTRESHPAEGGRREIGRIARDAAIYLLLLFPATPIAPPAALAAAAILCLAHYAARASASEGRKGGFVCWAGRCAAPMRWALSAFALTGFLVFLPLLKEMSGLLYAAAALAAAVSILPSRRWIFSVAHAFVICSALYAYLAPGPILRDLASGDLPEWLEPVMVRRYADLSCRGDFPDDDFQYRIRNIAFEPDESAVYAAAITRKRAKYNGPTAFKVGLAPGVEDRCWADGVSNHVGLDPEARRLYVSVRKGNEVRVLNADTFDLIDSWKLNPDAVAVETLHVPEQGILWELSEGHEFEAYGVDDGKLRYGLEDQRFHAEFQYEPETNVLYSANMGPHLISAIALKKGARSRASRLGVASWCVELVEGTNDLFATDYVLGMVYKLDRRTLKTVWQKRLGPGLRPVYADKERGLLLVGNQMTGKLTAFGLDDLKKKWELWVGSGMQVIDKGPASGKIYLGTKAGLFRFELERALQAHSND